MAESTDGLHERTLKAAGALAEYAGGDLHRISALTDEEILALVRPEDLEGFDLPWVTAREAARPTYSRDECRLVALRSLLVRGGITTEHVMAAVEGRESAPDPAAFTPNALLAGILARRALAPLVLCISGPGEERTTTMRVFVDLDGTVMHEVTSPDGLHHFFMSSLSHAVKGIRARLNPSGLSAGTKEGQEVITGSWESLEKDGVIGPVLTTATTRSQLRVENKRDGVSKDVAFAVGPSGTVVIQSSSGGDDLHAILVSDAEFQELITALLDLGTLGD